MQSTEAIWTEYHERLVAFIARRVGATDAEDIAHDVFLKIHARLGTLNDEARVRPWLYQIARNAIIDHYRTRRPNVSLPEWLEASEPTENEAVTEELSDCLVSLIERLPEKYRTALRRFEMDGVAHRDIAQREEISISGAKSRVQRGRHMLRKLLEDCCAIELDRRGQPIDVDRKNECGGC